MGGVWISDRFLAGVAAQLGQPTGFAGRLVGRILNRGNRSAVTAAVAATALEPGQVAVDVGFGGGVGLPLLLDRVGPTGTVHGVEISETMLAQARSRFGSDLDSGQLRLHEAPMGQLPLGDGSVDAVITTNTVYFVDNLSAAFAELARVLRPGGRAVLGIGDPKAMAAMPFTKHGFRLRSLTEITSDLTAAGLVMGEDRRVGDGETAFHLLVCTKP